MSYTVLGRDAVLVDTNARSDHFAVMEGMYWIVEDGQVSVRLHFTAPVEPKQVEAHVEGRLTPRRVRDIYWIDERQAALLLNLEPGLHILDFHGAQDSEGRPVEGPGLWLEVLGDVRAMAWRPGALPAVQAQLRLPREPRGAGPAAVRDGRALIQAGRYLTAGDETLQTLWLWDGRTRRARLLGGLWDIREAAWLPGGRILVLTGRSAFILDDRGSRLAGLVEDAAVLGGAVGPEGTVALLVAGSAGEPGDLPVDLVLFTPEGEELRRWPALIRQGWIGGVYPPEAEPHWQGDRIYFVHHVTGEGGEADGRRLMRFDPETGRMEPVAMPGNVTGLRRAGPYYRVTLADGVKLYDPAAGDWLDLELPGADDLGATRMWLLEPDPAGGRAAFSAEQDHVYAALLVWDAASGLAVPLDSLDSFQRWWELGWDGERYLWLRETISLQP